VSEIITKTQVFVRYFRRDENGDVDEKTIRWLGAEEERDKWHYFTSPKMCRALDWYWRYEEDLPMALDMANKLAQIVKVGKRRLKVGAEFELVLVREETKRTVTVLDKDNGMIVLALAAL
jgi:hypothetical protein